MKTGEGLEAQGNFNMNKKQNNYAFIDSHNLVRGVQSLGWHIDWFRFRIYLKEKYGVTTAYLFLGFLSERSNMYDLLQKAGFISKKKQRKKFTFLIRSKRNLPIKRKAPLKDRTLRGAFS